MKIYTVHNNVLELEVYDLASAIFLASSLAHTVTCNHFPVGNINYPDWLQLWVHVARDEAKKIAEDRSGFCTGIDDYGLEGKRFVIKICVL